MGRMVWVITIALIVGACAASGPRPGEEARELLRLAGSREADPPRDGSEVFMVDTLAVSSARAFAAVRFTYESIGIPFTHYDTEQLRLGGFIQELGRLGSDRPSTWVDCGQGATADPYANQYEVSMAVGTRVRVVDAQTSTVETVIRARARARDVSADLLRCRSFGTFEARIADMVRARVGG
jgi:hypothetical protein